MAGLDVDFKRIRAHRGDQRGGFEELCCQLAGLEDTAADSHFMRKGPGADQGLECYRTYADGHEVGWQAKYFINEFDAGQVADLKDSLTRALAAHPQLMTFIVCLPIDLQDNRAGKKLSQNQRYEKWRKESINAAAAAGRTLDIQLWSASSISERLGRDLPAYSGRARYWFDAVHFSSAWFRDMFEVPRHNLGERYSPESHVDLPIQRALQGLARDPGLLEQPGDWAAAITEKLDTAGRSVQRDGLENAAKNLRLACEPLLQALSSSAPALENDVPVARWAELAKAASDSVASALNQLEEKSGGKERYSTRRELYELHSAIDHVRRELNTSAWQLLNERALVVTGPAGIGKSHLVADFGARQLEQGRPSVLVLTGTLAQGDALENEAVTGAFVSSLAWRTPKAFTERTAQWIEQVCERTDRSPYGLLLLVATEPDNGFNADWLHNHLWPRSMPERDATWSVFLARDDLSEGGAVESLIEWAWEVNPEEVDERRSWLSALTLTWCLSTSNRAVRDRATKSLVNLLSWNLAHASALVEKFAGVNDLYITERLLAACHGAVMQTTQP